MTKNAQNLTSILTDVSELQAALLSVPNTGDALERLCKIRKAALTMLDIDAPPISGECAQSRQDLLGQLKEIETMISTEDLRTIPDFSLLRIASQADKIANQARTYLLLRNMSAAETARLSHNNKCLEVQ